MDSEQHQLRLHQKNIISSATRAPEIRTEKLYSKVPSSPQLRPLGTPLGPMTPLTLEQERRGEYFITGL